MRIPTFRIGHGYDLHRLQAGGLLWLGGVMVSDEISPIAHSDGDVVIHALVDSLLGAMGMGDIGELFPDTESKWKSAPSRLFLEDVCRRAREADWRIVNADITILAEKPRLKPFKPEIVRVLSEAMNCPVNVKAGTNEKCDSIGRGEAIAAHAVVLLMRPSPLDS